MEDKELVALCDEIADMRIVERRVHTAWDLVSMALDKAKGRLPAGAGEGHRSLCTLTFEIAEGLRLVQKHRLDLEKKLYEIKHP